MERLGKKRADAQYFRNSEKQGKIYMIVFIFLFLVLKKIIFRLVWSLQFHHLIKRACMLSRIWLIITLWITVAHRLLCPWDSPGKNAGVSAISSFRGSSPPRDGTWVSSIVRQTLYQWATWEGPREERWVNRHWGSKKKTSKSSFMKLIQFQVLIPKKTKDDRTKTK